MRCLRRTLPIYRTALQSLGALYQTLALSRRAGDLQVCRYYLLRTARRPGSYSKAVNPAAHDSLAAMESLLVHFAPKLCGIVAILVIPLLQKVGEAVQ
jgi:predicted ATP-grasp superfamily ATP-dependent carboligase